MVADVVDFSGVIQDVDTSDFIDMAMNKAIIISGITFIFFSSFPPQK